MKPTQPADSPNSIPSRAVVLAAGKGTRMKSKLAKMLHPVCGKAMLDHIVTTLLNVCTIHPVVMVGHDADQVRAAVEKKAECVLQEPQLGTGHAVMSAEIAFEPLRHTQHQVIVCYGDMPLTRAETFRKLLALQAESKAPIAMLTVMNENPRGFGRIVRAHNGDVTAIVEEVSCTPEQLNIKELNPGVYCFDGAWLWQALKKITPNPQKGEYFLTDLVEIAVSEGLAVKAIATDDPDEVVGINNRVDLADANALLRKRINRIHMLNGVTMVDPHTTYIDIDVRIQPDTTILPNTYLQGNTEIGGDCIIGPNSLLRNATIGERVIINQSVVEDSRIDDDVKMGPFSRIRTNTHIQSGAYIGNFAEMKNTLFGKAMMAHFSYLGDATVGDKVNIGAGTITCNYDGVNKNPTIIEDGVFVGSDSMLIAPVTIGKRARTGAGAVVTKDVPPGETHVGVPAKKLKKTP